MKKVGIFTLNSNDNYGNKLQNYALKKVIEKHNFLVDTIWLKEEYSLKKMIIKKILFFNIEYRRQMNFEKFTQRYLKRKIFDEKKYNYDYFVVGSDQVWNYTFKGVKKKISKYFLDFSPREKNIAYAASIGVNTIDEEFKEVFKNGINNIEHVSVRENEAALALKNEIERENVEVVLDPTMLLTKDEWDKIIVKPKKLKNEKYILNYFLGEQSTKRKEAIEKIAKENNCIIINILDKNDPFYTCGPSEFLYLEKNAFLICTDSFHSSVFAILYNRPFVIFDIEQSGVKSMNSRIDTLISKFCLKDRRFNGKMITKKNLEHNYTNVYKILKVERVKSINFLKNALNVEGSDINEK